MGEEAGQHNNGFGKQRICPVLVIVTGQIRLLIWIHGGAFRMGSKEGKEFDPVPLQYLAKGYAIASLNYRLSQHAIFPAQIEDCKAAVRWLRARAARYKLDPNRFATWFPRQVVTWRRWSAQPGM